ncbi:MAG: class F sortase [Sporichthyaceae bacterium]
MKGWNAVESGGSARVLDREQAVEESGGSTNGRWRTIQFGLAAAAAVPLLFVGGINGWPWDGEPTTEAPVVEPVAGIGDPTRIEIASLKIDAQVDPIAGDGTSGALASPAKGKLGWLEAGPEPGEVGRAVVLGKDVFAGLKKAEIGDEIVVTTTDGKAMTFAITDVTTYEAAELPDSVYTGAAGATEMAFIAPAGKADAKGNYPDRLVVTSELVAE